MRMIRHCMHSTEANTMQKLLCNSCAFSASIMGSHSSNPFYDYKLKYWRLAAILLYYFLMYNVHTDSSAAVSYSCAIKSARFLYFNSVRESLFFINDIAVNVFSLGSLKSCIDFISFKYVFITTREILSSC